MGCDGWRPADGRQVRGAATAKAKVGSGWVEIFQFFGGLGWDHYSKSTKNSKESF